MDLLSLLAEISGNNYIVAITMYMQFYEKYCEKGI